MKHIKIFEEFGSDEIITFTSKRNPSITIKVTKSNGRISEIENKRNFRFPFKIGQSFTRNIETWASNNDFLMNGKDVGPEKKVMGIKISDIPQGHELRTMFPSKFKK